MCLTTFLYIHEFNLCVGFVAPFVDCQQLHLHLNFKPHVSAYTASRGTNLKLPVSVLCQSSSYGDSNTFTARLESVMGVMQT